MKQSKLMTVQQFIDANPVFSVGGIRHMLYQIKPDLEEAGAIVFFGRRIFIDEELFIDFVRKGGAKIMAGRKAARDNANKKESAEIL